jgi:proline iminopeptidase
MRVFIRPFLLSSLAILLLSGPAAAQKLYRKTFGDPKNPGMVFLHGGPGYNSSAFEMVAARELADRGYYVVVYDRRGTVRSPVKKAKYTFAEAEKDLKKVMKKSKLKHASLLGHSFGGAVAIHFAEDYPQLVDNVILVDAPINYPATFVTIRKACVAYYTAKNDTLNLKYMAMLDTMNTGRLDYATYCFAHAMGCKLYQPKEYSPEAKLLLQEASKDPQFKYISISRQGPVKGFYKSHLYTTIDLTADLEKLVETVPVYGIFGDEDGLFDAESLANIRAIIGDDHFFMVKNASHNVFLDQRENFLEVVGKIGGH